MAVWLPRPKDSFPAILFIASGNTKEDHQKQQGYFLPDLQSVKKTGNPFKKQGFPWGHKPGLLNRHLENCKIGGCKEIRQPFTNPLPTLRQLFANPLPTFRQPFVPTPLQPLLSVQPLSCTSFFVFHYITLKFQKQIHSAMRYIVVTLKIVFRI